MKYSSKLIKQFCNLVKPDQRGYLEEDCEDSTPGIHELYQLTEDTLIEKKEYIDKMPLQLIIMNLMAVDRKAD